MIVLQKLNTPKVIIWVGNRVWVKVVVTPSSHGLGVVNFCIYFYGMVKFCDSASLYCVGTVIHRAELCCIMLG